MKTKLGDDGDDGRRQRSSRSAPAWCAVHLCTVDLAPRPRLRYFQTKMTSTPSTITKIAAVKPNTT